MKRFLFVFTAAFLLLTCSIPAFADWSDDSADKVFIPDVPSFVSPNGNTTAGKCPCCMCNNARVDDKLTEDDNLSYLAVEESVRPFRILFASGCGEPFRLLVQFLIDGQWSAAAVYYPRYCPNCGRELLEYGPGA